MTTEQHTTPRHTTPRRLYRRSDERVIAGVASGLGDYFNVDPLLIRIALVASLVFGGLGIFLYAAAWFLVPEESSGRSAAQRLFGGAALGGGLVGGIVVVVGILVALTVLGAVLGAMPYDGGAFLFAALVIGIGALLLRRGGSGSDASAGTATAGPGGTTAADATVPQEPVRRAVRREPTPPSPLGWYVLGAVLVGIGLLALAGSAWDLAITPGAYAGVSLGIIGAGLLVAAVWGHARFLIVIGLLLLPVAWAASLVDVPLEGGFASRRVTPTSASAVADEYRLAGGRLVLDLTGVDNGADPIAFHASVAFGELIVLVPDDASVEVDASVGGGAMRILGTPQRGTHLETSEVVEGDGPHLVLDLEAGIGEIEVSTRVLEDRSR